MSFYLILFNFWIFVGSGFLAFFAISYCFGRGVHGWIIIPYYFRTNHPYIYIYLLEFCLEFWGGWLIWIWGVEMAPFHTLFFSFFFFLAFFYYGPYRRWWLTGGIYSLLWNPWYLTHSLTKGSLGLNSNPVRKWFVCAGWKYLAGPWVQWDGLELPTACQGPVFDWCRASKAFFFPNKKSFAHSQLMSSVRFVLSSCVACVLSSCVAFVLSSCVVACSFHHRHSKKGHHLFRYFCICFMDPAANAYYIIPIFVGEQARSLARPPPLFFFH